MRGLILLAAMATVVGWGVGGNRALAQHDHKGHKHAAESDAKAEVICPVMGEPANLLISAETDDGPVFFCCKNCVKKFNESPEKFAEKVATQRKVLADRPKVQVKCPVDGGAPNHRLAVKRDETKIHFCSKACMEKFESDAEPYRVALANSYTYQTKCPVMGGDIDPEASSVLATGERIYWCCMGCEKGFLKDLDKHAPKLVAQGYHVNVNKLKRAMKDK